MKYGYNKMNFIKMDIQIFVVNLIMYQYQVDN